jgi:hypothetical protein
MKYGSWKRLVLLLSGLVLLTFMDPGMAQNQTKTRSKSAVNPVTQGAAGTGTLLKAKSNPEIVAHKLSQVKYVPFTLNELKDPKTGQPPTATTVLTLRNGKNVTADKYLAAINDLEKKLNTWGYSLRGTQEKVTIQQVNYNKAKLQHEAAKPLPFIKGDARTQSLMTSPKLLQQEHVAAVKAYKATPKASSDSTAKAGSRVLKVPPGSIAQLLQPVTITKNFDDSWGDTSIFAAEVNGSLTFKGAQDSAGVSGQARATCSILGNTENLLLATADLSAPRTGNLIAKVKITTLGVDQVVLDQTQSGDWTKTDTFTRSLPDSFKVQYNTSIGPVPITATIGAKGSVSVPYFVGLLPVQAMGWMIPNVQSSVYAQAGIGVEYDDTGAVAGVEANLTLLNNKLVLFGGASEGTDTKGTFLKYSIASRDDVTALAGSVNAFVEAEVLGHGVRIFNDELFSFSGIQRTFTPLSGGDMVYLQRPEVRQATRARR